MGLLRGRGGYCLAGLSLFPAFVRLGVCVCVPDLCPLLLLPVCVLVSACLPPSLHFSPFCQPAPPPLQLSDNPWARVLPNHLLPPGSFEPSPSAFLSPSRRLPALAAMRPPWCPLHTPSLASPLLLLLFLLGGGAEAEGPEDPELLVTVRGGRLRGLRLMAPGGPVSAFLGIPFAEPPVGPRRFLPPEPKRPWPGVLNATAFQRVCYQYVDTLYTPALRAPRCGTPTVS